MTLQNLKYDKWLSKQVYFPCYYACPNGIENLLDVITKDNVFITYKIIADENVSSEQLIELGFAKVNTQVSFLWKSDSQKKIISYNSEIKFNLVEQREVAENLVLFADYFIYDRFHADKRLPLLWSKAIKENWILSKEGNKQVIVATFKEKIVGMILFNKEGLSINIELLSVIPDFRHQNVGGGMIMELQNMCAKKYNIRVGSQEDNYPAVRLYKSTAFKEVERRDVYHFFKQKSQPMPY